MDKYHILKNKVEKFVLQLKFLWGSKTYHYNVLIFFFGSKPNSKVGTWSKFKRCGVFGCRSAPSVTRPWSWGLSTTWTPASPGQSILLLPPPPKVVAYLKNKDTKCQWCGSGSALLETSWCRTQEVKNRRKYVKKYRKLGRKKIIIFYLDLRIISWNHFL